MLWERLRLARRASPGHASHAEKGYGTMGCPEKSAGSVIARPGNGTDADLPETWMSRIEDGIPLSAITIPGTHDSAAFTSSWPFIATQTMSIRKQLDVGIRYFDLRCGVRDNIVEMVHGPTFLGLRLDQVLQTMYRWLDAHRSEAVIVQIKQDREDSNSSVDFAHAIAALLRADSAFWRTANTTPTIEELRGRIQLFRRFEGPSLFAYGLDVSRWEDNPQQPFTIHTSHNTQLTIQDHYSWPSPKTLPGLIAEKGGNVAGLLDRAADDLDPWHWYINFTSAYEFNFYYQIPPREIALGGYWAFKWEAGMNERLRNFLGQKPRRRRRYGIVAMDYPEKGAEDLILQLVVSNFEQEERRVWGALRVFMAVVVGLALLCVVGLVHLQKELEHHLLTGRG